MADNDFWDLEDNIVKKGLCTGCGTCIGFCPTKALKFDFEDELPILEGSCVACGLCIEVCPGCKVPIEEMERLVFGEKIEDRSEAFGVHMNVMKGYASDDKIRRNAASGGLTTAILIYALEKRIIDVAIGAGMDEQFPWRTKPIAARTGEDVLKTMKSKYAITPNNAALKDIKKNERVAVVGLPCHIHGIRKVQLSEKLGLLKKNIIMTLGVFCGANTSYKVTEHVIQEFSDIGLDQIARLEYRGGEKSQDMIVVAKDGNSETITQAERMSRYIWLLRDRCLMCCDWSAEVADISLGDIFDPDVKKGWQKIPNWNSVIVRSKTGKKLIEDAKRDGAIQVFDLEKDVLYGNIGFESKKHGAVFRLKERKIYGWPSPEYDREFCWKPMRHKEYSIPE